LFDIFPLFFPINYFPLRRRFKQAEEEEVEEMAPVEVTAVVEAMEEAEGMEAVEVMAEAEEEAAMKIEEEAEAGEAAMKEEAGEVSHLEVGVVVVGVQAGVEEVVLAVAEGDHHTK
jgi:hypothetical protein